jgi:hypothetical protein
MTNGSVQIDVGSGPRQVTAGTTLTLPANRTSQTFTVTRTTSGQATTIPMIVTDGCGPWETFVGMGTGV